MMSSWASNRNRLSGAVAVLFVAVNAVVLLSRPPAPEGVPAVTASKSATAVTGAKPAAPSLAWLRGERVLVIGDSLLANTAPSLEPRLAATGATVKIEAHSGSGLGSDLWLYGDWFQRAPELMREFHPTVVIVEFCCNYWWPYNTGPDGQLIKAGTRPFRTFWEGRARRLARILTRDGA
jgi:hypothetical protein